MPGTSKGNPMSAPEFVAGLRPVPSEAPGDHVPWPAADLAGVTPDGTSVTVGLSGRRRPILLVFLSVRCDGCEAFWWRGAAARDDPVFAQADIIIVTKGPDQVSATEVGALAAPFEGTVVMGNRPW